MGALLISLDLNVEGHTGAFFSCDILCRSVIFLDQEIDSSYGSQFIFVVFLILILVKSEFLDILSEAVTVGDGGRYRDLGLVLVSVGDDKLDLAVLLVVFK